MNRPDGFAPAELLLHQRVLLAGGLAAIVAASWAYLWAMAGDMAASTRHALHTGAGLAGSHDAGISAILVMWLVMVGAMMLPTAAPMTFIHARFQRGREHSRSPAPYSALFALGYLAAWSVFAIVATALQVGLEHLALLDGMGMSLTSAPLAGGVLIGAGLFQWSRFKDACLTQCRTPVGFFMGFWREGHGGALAMGLHHGLYCVGCCWALMAVMFVVGTMNMLWIALLTAAMLFEKLGPAGDRVGQLIGVALVAAGGWLLLS
ncbi:MAG: DUF2182 domain-containing protein [Gammaproteobacteria bacterium]